ncbi:MAG: AAA family ATPase, partial [Actinobacteria bacterium]|nr:AAA family ATPase [Actinomycetota bacterium]
RSRGHRAQRPDRRGRGRRAARWRDRAGRPGRRRAARRPGRATSRRLLQRPRLRQSRDLPVRPVSPPDRTLLEDSDGTLLGRRGTRLLPEQAAVVLDREGPLMVAANAGSGKTTVLVERFVRHVVEDGIDPRAILTITFTRRAAGELRGRIRERLLELGCAAEARRLEGAWISTIDGFCNRVLRSHAVLAGLDPRADILAPAELELLVQDAWEDAVGGLIADPGVLDLLDRFGYEELLVLVRGLHDELRSAGTTVPRLPLPAPESDADRLLFPALKGLDALLAAFGAQFTRRKHARHGLDYADLAIGTRDLFLRHPAVAQGYAARLQRVMVDEFQDTNRLQVELFEALGQPNVFFVGDRLQSIYGFRHADVGGFEREWERFGAQGRARELATNFRSRPEILGLINAAFGDAHDRYTPLAPGRQSAQTGPAVEVLLTDSSAWSQIPVEDPLMLGLATQMPDGAPTAVRAEARLLAQRIAELVAAGRKAGEIVVLLRATTHMASFERAIELAGVPVIAGAGTGWWDRREVQDVLNLLAVVANPYEESALLGLLAGPLGRLSSDDLALLALERRARRGSLWEVVGLVARGERDGLPGRVGQEARERLTALYLLIERERGAAVWSGPADLIERLVADTGFDIHILRGSDGDRRLANVRKLARIADDFARRSGGDLRAFIDHVAVERRTARRTPDAPLDAGEDDVVRVMTVHGAKGLEFPVVVLADIGRSGQGGAGSVLVRDGRVGLKLRRSDGGEADVGFAYDELAAGHEQREIEEERRIVHVAVTRAEELLILSGTFDGGKGWGAAGLRRPALAWMGPGLFGDATPSSGSRTVGGVPVAVTVSEPLSGALRLAPPPPVAPPAAPVPPPVVEQPAPGPPPAPPATLSYSSLREYDRCGYGWYLRRVLDLPAIERPAGTGGTLALRRGSVAHAVLEHARFDVGAAPPTQEEVVVAAEQGGIDLEGIDLAEQLALAATFLDGPLRARAAAAVRVRREAPFAVALTGALPDGPLLTGVIDLLVDEQEGAVLVVDYKTDHVAPDDDLEAHVAGT